MRLLTCVCVCIHIHITFHVWIQTTQNYVYTQHKIMSKLHIFTIIYMYKIYIFFTSTLLSDNHFFLFFFNLTWVFFYSILHLWLLQIGFRIRLTISNGHPLGLLIGICDCYSGWPVLSFFPLSYVFSSYYYTFITDCYSHSEWSFLSGHSLKLRLKVLSSTEDLCSLLADFWGHYPSGTLHNKSLLSFPLHSKSVSNKLVYLSYSTSYPPTTTSAFADKVALWILAIFKC